MNALATRVAIKRELLRRSAQTRLIDFIYYVKLDYRANWHHTLIADKLDQFLSGDKGRLMLFVPPQHGKAMEIRTPVLTTKGWKKHGDLNVGDCVFSPSGTPVRVIARTNNYLHPCVKMKFDKCELICAKEHEWEVHTERGDLRKIIDGKRVRTPRVRELIEAQDINPKSHRRNPSIPTSNPLTGTHNDLPIDPYFLGCWLGDGASASGQLTTSLGDMPHYIEHIQYDVKKINDNTVSTAKTILFDGAHHDLYENGLIKNKHIPDIYFTAPISARESLLQGIIDTDGSINDRGTVEIVTIKKQLAMDYIRLVCTLGHKPSLHKDKAKLNGRVISDRYRICFHPDRNVKICRLPRKLKNLINKKAKDRDDKKSIFIQDVTCDGQHFVNCIQVEGGMYLVGDWLIPTHNSEIASRCLPAYVLGKNPNTKIAACSYSIDLARSFNRDVQRIIDSRQYKDIFPDTELNSSRIAADSRGAFLRNTEEFEVVGYKGGFKAVGVMGGLSGRAVDLAIIDDPVKDALEASSETYRERVWEWYLNVLETRLHNNSKVILIMTRWHEDDLAGRLLERQPEKWEVIKIPAVKESGGLPEDPREIGEPLWPVKHSLEKLNDLRALSERTFTSLYQQSPTTREGDKIKRAWFQYCREDELPGRLTWDLWVDGAYTKNTANDPTGLMLAAFDERANTMYIKHAHSGHMELPELLAFVPQYTELHGMDGRGRAYIEPKASGKSLRQMLKVTSKVHAVEIKTALVNEGKEARAQVASPKIESGRVVLVRGTWNDHFVEQVCGFPNAKHDEYIDLLGYSTNLYFDLRGGSRKPKRRN